MRGALSNSGTAPAKPATRLGIVATKGALPGAGDGSAGSFRQGRGASTAHPRPVRAGLLLPSIAGVVLGAAGGSSPPARGGRWPPSPERARAVAWASPEARSAEEQERRGTRGSLLYPGSGVRPATTAATAAAPPRRMQTAAATSVAPVV